MSSERWIDLRFIDGRKSGLYVGNSGLHVVDEEFCTCVGFQFRKKCRHVEELKMIEIEDIVNGKGVREFKSSLSAVNDLFGESAYNSDEIFAYYGMSKIGKTLLCFQEAMWFASQGLNVLYLETEGGMSQFIKKWHDVFVARFGEKKGKVYMVSKKSIETLMHYLGFRVQVVFKSAGGGKKEEKGKLEFKVLETLRDEDVPIINDIQRGNIDVLILDSLSSPLRVFTTDRQSFPAKSDCAGYILRTLAKLQEMFGIAVIVVNHACHTAETKTFVKGKGIVTYEDVEVGDEVFALDENGNVVWSRVLKKFVYDYEGEIIHLKGKSAEFKVTPNHRVLVRDYDYKWGFRKSVPRVLDSLSYIEAEKIKRFAYVPRAAIKEYRMLSDEEAIEREPLAYLFGWYLAEGDLQYNGKYPGQIRLSINEKDLILVEKTLKKIGQKYSVYRYKNNSAVYVVFNNSELWRQLKKFGRGAHNKKIPREFTEKASIDEKLSLLRGYLSGDGHREYKHWKFTTVSKRLWQDLIEMCMSLGMAVWLREREPSNKISYVEGRKIVSKSKSYVANIRETNRSYVTKKKEWYKGKVWCLMTEHGNFAVLYGGKLAFSGNSHDPTNPYESEIQMRGGSAVQYYSKRIVFIDKRAMKEFSDYRRFWLVRAEDIKAWSKATVARITDFGYEDIDDKGIIDKVFTQGEQKKLG